MIKGNYTVLENEKLNIYEIEVESKLIKKVIKEIESDKQNVLEDFDNFYEYDYKRAFKSYPEGKIINTTTYKQYESYTYSETDGSGCESEEKEGSHLVVRYSFDIIEDEVAELYALLNHLLNNDYKAVYEIVKKAKAYKETLKLEKEKTNDLIKEVNKNLNEEKIDELTKQLEVLKKKKNGLIGGYYNELLKGIKVNYVKEANINDLEEENERMRQIIKYNDSLINSCVNRYKDDDLQKVNNKKMVKQ